MSLGALKRFRSESISTPYVAAGAEGLAVAKKVVTFYEKAQLIERPGRDIRKLPLAVRIGFASRYMLTHDHITPDLLIGRGGGRLALPTIAAAKAAQGVLRQAAAFLAQGGLSYADKRLTSLHLDEVRKAVPEMGFSAGWDVQPNLDGERAVRRFHPETLAFLRESIIEGGLRPPLLAVPKDTSHGDPTFSTGLDDLGAHLGMALEASASHHALDSVLAETRRIDPILADISDRPLIIIGSRTGPNAKQRPVAAFVDGRLHWVGEFQGIDCRRRSVRMMSTFINEVIRPGALRNFGSLKASAIGHSFAHGSTREINAKMFSLLREAQDYWGAAAVISSHDASNFDDTIAGQHLTDMRDVASAGLYTEAERHALRLTEDAPTVSGPLTVGFEAYSYSRRHGMPSGLITTSYEDSLVSFGVCFEAWAEALNLTLQRMRSLVRSRALSILVQGDDTNRIGPLGDEATYSRVLAEFGLDIKHTMDPVFLKVWHQGPGLWHNLASRACVRSLHSEYRPAGPASDLFAVYIRFTLARHDPYFAYFWDIMTRTHATLIESGARDLKTLRSWVVTHADDLITEQRGATPSQLASLFDVETASAQDQALVEWLRSRVRFGAYGEGKYLPRDEAMTLSTVRDWRSYLRTRVIEAKGDVL